MTNLRKSDKKVSYVVAASISNSQFTCKIKQIPTQLKRLMGNYSDMHYEAMTAENATSNLKHCTTQQMYE